MDPTNKKTYLTDQVAPPRITPFYGAELLGKLGPDFYTVCFVVFVFFFKVILSIH